MTYQAHPAPPSRPRTADYQGQQAGRPARRMTIEGQPMGLAELALTLAMGIGTAVGVWVAAGLVAALFA